MYVAVGPGLRAPQWLHGSAPAPRVLKAGGCCMRCRLSSTATAAAASASTSAAAAASTAAASAVAASNAIAAAASTASPASASALAGAVAAAAEPSGVAEPHHASAAGATPVLVTAALASAEAALRSRTTVWELAPPAAAVRSAAHGVGGSAAASAWQRGTSAGMFGGRDLSLLAQHSERTLAAGAAVGPAARHRLDGSILGVQARGRMHVLRFVTGKLLLDEPGNKPVGAEWGGRQHAAWRRPAAALHLQSGHCPPGRPADCTNRWSALSRPTWGAWEAWRASRAESKSVRQHFTTASRKFPSGGRCPVECKLLEAFHTRCSRLVLGGSGSGREGDHAPMRQCGRAGPLRLWLKWLAR